MNISMFKSNPIKLLREKYESWQFAHMEKVFHSSSGDCYKRINKKIESELSHNASTDYYSGTSSSPVILLGRQLRERILNEYRNKYENHADLRILIHIPPSDVSPAGSSVFSNLVSCFGFMGIPARGLYFTDCLNSVLKEFSPNMLLTSDHELYLSRIDWDLISKYRIAKKLKIGLTASLEEYGNTPLKTRLISARLQGVDFFYSFRSSDYIRNRKEYIPFFDEGFPVISIEFGANPLIHFPEFVEEPKVDYVFLASSNYDKWKRYVAYLQPIAKKYKGIVAGPGWSFCSGFRMRPECDRFFYACARIGLNLSIDDQILWASELNERTYILAACGVPQLIDNPKLLAARFSDDSLFSADSPREYVSLYRDMLSSPEECERRSLIALGIVYDRHTIFHRVDAFMEQLHAEKVV